MGGWLYLSGCFVLTCSDYIGTESGESEVVVCLLEALRSEVSVCCAVMIMWTRWIVDVVVSPWLVVWVSILRGALDRLRSSWSSSWGRVIWVGFSESSSNCVRLNFRMELLKLSFAGQQLVDRVILLRLWIIVSRLIVRREMMSTVARFHNDLRRCDLTVRECYHRRYILSVFQHRVGIVRAFDSTFLSAVLLVRDLRWRLEWYETTAVTAL